ncbi:hypothetical protein GCM10022206_65040 [Streptomyces chiangmaiensis]
MVVPSAIVASAATGAPLRKDAVESDELADWLPGPPGRADPPPPQALRPSARIDAEATARKVRRDVRTTVVDLIGLLS